MDWNGFIYTDIFARMLTDFTDFLIFLMMAIISSEGDHTDARLRLRLTDLYGSRGFSDCSMRTVVTSPERQMCECAAYQCDPVHTRRSQVSV